jgi:hypothetical protein
MMALQKLNMILMSWFGESEHKNLLGDLRCILVIREGNLIAQNVRKG